MDLEKRMKRAEASFTLSQQIVSIGNEPARLLNTVVKFAVETIGDGCAAALLTLPGDRLKVYAFHHKNPGAQELLRKSVLQQGYGLEGAVEWVVNAGEPLLVPTLDQEKLVQIARPEQIEYIEQVGVQSIMIVPIKGRGAVLGTLTLFRDREGSPYTKDDLAYLMDIASRTGLAIDNTSLTRSLNLESSGRRTAEEALNWSEVRFRSIFASTSLGIKLLDLDGNILETNPAFQEMLGYSKGELAMNSISSYLHPAEVRRVVQILNNLKTGRAKSIQLEHRLISKDGSIVWVNATFTGIKIDEQDGPITFIVAIAENITKRKRLEAEMAEMKSRLSNHVEMERLKLAQELHDGPMQVLYTTIYKMENWDDHTSPEDREKMDALKQDLLNVVQGLRNTAKDLRPPTLASFGLEKAIQSHAEEFTEDHPELSIDLELDEDGQLLPENIRLLLFRVYQHSLTNVLRHGKASQVDVRFSFDAEQAHLEIRDNGAGFVVPDSWVELVRHGHYGLAGEVERINLVDGTFLVESAPGAGTTVRVIIPLKEIPDST